MIYVDVDSPNLGSRYFNFLGGGQLKKTPCIILLSLFEVKLNIIVDFVKGTWNLIFC